LDSLGEELRFALITSRATVHAFNQAPADSAATELPALKLVISPSDNEKCERCWHHTPDVGADSAYPSVCKRCVDNIAGAGETRQFA
jgi:isoleucyl-tRNA synthetase